MSSQRVASDKFTSVYEMEAMANFESQLQNTLSDFITKQREKLQLLTAKLDWLKEVRPPEMSTEEVISDPINAYLLVKRLTRDWPLILNLMIHGFDIQDDFSRLPDNKDLQSAVRGLARLHHVYGASDAGLTRTPEGSGGLTAKDCFELGMYFMDKEKQYNNAEWWFRKTLEIIYNGDKTIYEDKVLSNLYVATFYSDCKKKIKPSTASKVLEYLMMKYPNHTLDNECSSLYRQALSGNCSDLSEKDKAYEYSNAIYSNVCRGIGLNYSSELRCFYLHHNNPRLLIAPFKMEEINIDPPLLMFHDVISDDEIKEMKEAFGRNRQACTVLGKEGSTLDTGRTCDVGWVYDEYSEVTARLTRRVGDMTNLDMKTSEAIQVASYSLGGEYKPHYDTIQYLNFSTTTDGGRIATFMFYLSDVEKGGYTAFPELNQAVRPVKGSAAFWFNLDHRSLNLHQMLHGGCPVLKGSKWVLNKWIHEGNQNNEMFCPVDEKFPKPRYYLNGIK